MKALVVKYTIFTFLFISCASRSDQRVMGPIRTVTNRSNDSHEISLRSPSSVSQYDCLDMMMPALRVGHNLDPSDWQLEHLEQEQLIDSNFFNKIVSDPDWQRFVSRTDQDDEARQMAFSALAILKKRYPKASDANIKDRFSTLKAFCGNS